MRMMTTVLVWVSLTNLSPAGWLKQWRFLRSPRRRCCQVQGLVRTVPGLQTDIFHVPVCSRGVNSDAHSPIAHYSHPSELHPMPLLSAKYFIVNHPLFGGLGLDLWIGMEYTHSIASTTFNMPFPVGLKWETRIVKQFWSAEVQQNWMAVHGCCSYRSPHLSIYLSYFI